MGLKILEELHYILFWVFSLWVFFFFFFYIAPFISLYKADFFSLAIRFPPLPCPSTFYVPILFPLSFFRMVLLWPQVALLCAQVFPHVSGTKGNLCTYIYLFVFLFNLPICVVAVVNTGYFNNMSRMHNSHKCKKYHFIIKK